LKNEINLIKILVRFYLPLELPTDQDLSSVYDLELNNKSISGLGVNSRINNIQSLYGNGLKGIRNNGNMCYLNSILQCLSSTHKLVEYFLTNNFQSDLNRSDASVIKNGITEEFFVIIKAIWEDNFQIISAYKLKYIIGKSNQQFNSNDQQDSQELLLFLLDGLHEDLNRVRFLIRKNYSC